MNQRQLTQTDRLLAGIGDALRTLGSRTSLQRRPSPAGDTVDGSLSESEREHAAGLMRVNHAGEVAAQGLYQGHAAVARSPAVRQHMKAAAAEELDHLAWCEQRLDELGSAPSALRPIWYGGAVATGIASGILGDKWSLGFVEETEKQVSAHLSGHLEKLPEGDHRSRAIIRQMRDEEEIHGANAKNAGAAEIPTPIRHLMRAVARIMTGTAYRL